MDEFEKRMHFSAFITTLADAVTKMNPTSLVSSEAQKIIEAAELKPQLQAATKKWLDMVVAFTEKATTLGSKYPIEEVLGIKIQSDIKS